MNKELVNLIREITHLETEKINTWIAAHPNEYKELEKEYHDKRLINIQQNYITWWMGEKIKTYRIV